jgi:hypothetical protein
VIEQRVVPVTDSHLERALTNVIVEVRAGTRRNKVSLSQRLSWYSNASPSSELGSTRFSSSSALGRDQLTPVGRNTISFMSWRVEFARRVQYGAVTCKVW